MKQILLIVFMVVAVRPVWSQSSPSGSAMQPMPGLFDAPSQNEAPQEKSVLLAAGLSLILPGMGELYADNFGTGKYFLIADGVLWLTYAGLSVSSTWVQGDADLYVTQHAGAALSGKGEQFRVDVGNYMTVYEYNEAKLRAREYANVYDPVQFYWSWDSDPNRNAYRDLRISSDRLERNATFVLGALVVNRLISAFVAGRSAASYNKGLRESRSWNLGARVVGGIINPHGIELKLTLVL